MEASQLKIDPRHLQFDKMSMGKRSALRRENIKALIQSKPAGTPITTDEFVLVTRSTGGATYGMIQTMVRKKVISKIPAEKGLFSYAVNDATVVVPKKPKAEPTIKTSMETESLVEKAKSFVWQTSSDSLRDFIKWLDGGEK